MKALIVPAGMSEVAFRFSPTGLRIAVALGYLAFAAALVLWIRARRAEARIAQHIVGV